jgi:UDP-N-acetylmuramoyl-tripeptide--D-alanyl-D-alanine ligase
MPEVLWTSAEIAAATGGRATGDFTCKGVSIDSRSVEAGDLFVALAGVRDGHEFVPGAVQSGAAGVLASQDVSAPAVIVPDTLRALEQLGAAARDRSQARRCAVTGSVGKTSVTQAVMQGLMLAGRAHSSVKSYNNHIGVPLTLARMPKATERAVFEIGMNHAGEIEPLSQMVKPHCVAITTVGPVHIENFPDGEEGVARAKAEIFAGLQPGGVAVLNRDNVWFDLLAVEARRVGAKVASFGTSEDCTARLVSFNEPLVKAVIHGRPIEFPLRQSGLHWGLNSLCVLLTLEAMDVDVETGVEALSAFAPLAGRGETRTVRIPGGTFTLVDESYNANPISMAATIKSLGQRSADGRRIVALTDMLELGPDGPSFHAALAKPLEQAQVDLVFCAGPQMKSLWQALPATRQGAYAETAAELSEAVVSAVEPGDVVMVKGSNGSRAGAIAAALTALDSAGASA